MIGLIIALISGALMSIQGVFNTEVTKSSSIWAANCFVQFTALVVCLNRLGICQSKFPFGCFPGTAQIHASGRRYRCFYYLYRH